MPADYSLVLQQQRHLKWRALDPLEQVLMILCGVAITGFCVLVMCDIVTRTIGHPWLWLQEATMTFFVYGIFIGVGAATRRNDHLYLSVLVVTAFTPVSLASMMAPLFNGMDVEALLAVPFFLLVGDLMTSANVTVRMIRLSQTMVGHLRGGLAQVVTLFSMFFAGISGSSAADVAVLTRTLGPEMNREGYDKGFTAALIASASTMANL